MLTKQNLCNHLCLIIICRSLPSLRLIVNFSLGHVPWTGKKISPLTLSVKYCLLVFVIIFKNICSYPSFCKGNSIWGKFVSYLTQKFVTWSQVAVCLPWAYSHLRVSQFFSWVYFMPTFYWWGQTPRVTYGGSTLPNKWIFLS